MKNDYNIGFAELLEKRKKLSNENKENVKKITSNDSQLNDVIKNFNESNEYINKIKEIGGNHESRAINFIEKH